MSKRARSDIIDELVQSHQRIYTEAINLKTYIADSTDALTEFVTSVGEPFKACMERDLEKDPELDQILKAMIKLFESIKKNAKKLKTK